MKAIDYLNHFNDIRSYELEITTGRDSDVCEPAYNFIRYHLSRDIASDIQVLNDRYSIPIEPWRATQLSQTKDDRVYNIVCLAIKQNITEDKYWISGTFVCVKDIFDRFVTDILDINLLIKIKEYLEKEIDEILCDDSAEPSTTDADYYSGD